MSGLWSGLHYRQSLASRVTILTTLAVGFAVSLVAFAAYATVRAQSTDTLDESLRERARAAVSESGGGLSSTGPVPSWVTGAANVKIAVIDRYGNVLRIDDGVHLDFGQPELAVARGHSKSEARTIAAHGIRYRVVTVPASDGLALSLAQSTEPTDRMLDRLGLVALLFGLAGMIVAGLAGWAVARNGLRPVRRLTAAVEDIARTERLAPIPVDGDDEVARLATAFNGMLTALSASQARQRQLVADASHELRTPLTSLRTNLDLLVQADSRGGLSADSRRELLDDVRAQINEMTTLIGDLVELARDEPVTSTVEPVDLAEVVQRAIDRARRRSISGIRFEVRTDPWWVTGEASALERAVTNLLDNAVKWSPAQGTVHVRLEQGTLSVADEGQGIAPDDLPHVFDRFYRSTESRSMPGSGLGLSIVRAVVDRHGGQVRVTNADDGGAIFWIRLPGAEVPAQ